ncbi:MAG: transposase [Planctomycetaceae bacterium]
MSKDRGQFKAEYQREALWMVEQQQLSVAEVASHLGIKANLLYRWKAQFAADGQQAFPGSGQQMAQEAELARLRRENEQLHTERDIIKKATVFFANESR